MNKTETNTPLIEIKDAGNRDYLSLPTEELLEAFGQGSHIPGSGSAAAFSGLMAIELMRTVLKLSIGRDEYKKHKKEFELILERITNEAKPKFRELFNKDIQTFHQVSYHRRLRDKAQEANEKEQHKKIANEKLREATDIPLDICTTSLDLMESAFAVFDKGFKGARGDSGVAISNLLSAAQGALFVVFLNLKSFQKSNWKDERMEMAVELSSRFTKLQREAFSRVVTLYNENADSSQLSLDYPK